MRRGSSCLLLLTLLLLSGSPLASQEAPQPATGGAGAAPSPFVQRLASVGRLWGVVRYLHPYLAYKEIDWDAAFLAAVPKVRAASSTQEYEAAVQGLLDALHDPVTHVIAEPPAAAPSAAKEGAPPAQLFRWLDGEVLYVDLRPEIDLFDPKVGREQGQKLPAELRRARRVIVDLRSSPGSSPRGWDPFDILGVQGELVTRPALAPTQRFLQHSGYVGQTFKGSGGYSAGFVTLLATTYTPDKEATDKREVFLVNGASEVPNLALALQGAGIAEIVAVGSPPTEEGTVLTRTVDLGEGLQARVRTAELVPQPGWPGVHADLLLPAPKAGEATDSALEAARRRLTAPPVKKAAAKGAAPAALPNGVWRADKTYPDQKDPGRELRLLAVVRLWNVIEHFYPYKALIGDWGAVLPEFLAKMDASQGARGYAWTLAEMAARIADAHTGISGHPELEALFGLAAPPFGIRWIEGGCVVTNLADPPEGQGLGVEPGDLVESIDGKPTAERMAELRPYVAGATEPWLRSRLCRAALAGAKDSQVVIGLRDLQDQKREVTLKRIPSNRTKPGETLRLLPGNIGYADLTRLSVPEVGAMFERFKDTRAIVFDMRGYPRGTAWAIAPRINVRNSPYAAAFRRRIVSGGTSGEEGESGFFFQQPLGNRPEGKYTRPTVMLIDERAISQSEHSGLFYEAANGTRFIGSTTAGSNGDVTDLTLPGGIEVFFTGHDVRHADGRQLQRVGLVPDVEVTPTRAGLHAGKDEVLDRALEELERTLPKEAAKP